MIEYGMMGQGDRAARDRDGRAGGRRTRETGTTHGGDDGRMAHQGSRTSERYQDRTVPGSQVREGDPMRDSRSQEGRIAFNDYILQETSGNLKTGH